jgi:lipoprotein-releasing system permease protein
MWRVSALILRTASVYMLGKRRQTLLVILGVALGSMVLIVTFALTDGIIADIEEKIIAASPLITVKGEKLLAKPRNLFPDSAGRAIIVSRIIPGEKKEVKPYPETVAAVKAVPGITAASPFVQTKGVLRKGKLFRPVLLKGVLPAEEAQIANLDKNIVAGSLSELGFTPSGILLGQGLARKLRADYHDLVRLTGQNGRVYILTVTGIFASGFGAVDDHNAYLNLPLAQTLAGFGGAEVTGIGVHVSDPSAVAPLARQIEYLTGYRTESWQEANENLLTLFRRNNNITFMLVIFVFLVSGFGIANVLIAIVLQKRRDIAILCSLGFGRSSIVGIFLAQGLIIGMIGTAIGLLAGHLSSNLIAHLPISYGESAIVRGTHIAMRQSAHAYLLTALFSVLVSGFAAYGPARRAARLSPVEILRT